MIVTVRITLTEARILLRLVSGQRATTPAEGAFHDSLRGVLSRAIEKAAPHEARQSKAALERWKRENL